MIVLDLQSLCNWCAEDENSLSNLIQELLSEYRTHHRRLVAAQERLSFELNTLLESSEYGDIDVHCSPASDGVSVLVTIGEMLTRSLSCVFGCSVELTWLQDSSFP